MLKARSAPTFLKGRSPLAEAVPRVESSPFVESEIRRGAFYMRPRKFILPQAGTGGYGIRPYVFCGGRPRGAFLPVVRASGFISACALSKTILCGILFLYKSEYGIPYQRPAGGHAIFVDAPKVLTCVPKEEFPAQTLTIELYLEAGIRGCEIGYLLADRDPVTRQNRFNGLDLLRLAIPRRVYTDNHMDVIAAALKNVYDRRESVTRGVHITWEAP